MFENASKDMNDNANQLKKDVSGKIGEIGKDLKNEVTGNVKNLLGDMPLPGSDAHDFLGNTTNAIGDAMGGLDNKIGWAIGNSTGDAGKKMGGLMKKVTEMPKAGLDFVNKKLKGRTGDLLNKTLAAAKGEMKGLVDGFVGALGLDGLKNITGEGLDSKMKWLKNKFNSIVGDHSARFDVGSKAGTEEIFADFIAILPSEYRVEEPLEEISLSDIDLMRNTPVKEDAFHNVNNTEFNVTGERPDVAVEEESTPESPMSNEPTIID